MISLKLQIKSNTTGDLFRKLSVNAQAIAEAQVGRAAAVIFPQITQTAQDHGGIGSPVLTGQFQRGWETTAKSTPTEVVATLANETPYGPLLEGGYSPKAPNGVIRPVWWENQNIFSLMSVPPSWWIDGPPSGYSFNEAIHAGVGPIGLRAVEPHIFTKQNKFGEGPRAIQRYQFNKENLP